MGVFVAGWADMGLHPETFWLGYATIAAAGWNPAARPAAGAAGAASRLLPPVLRPVRPRRWTASTS